MKRKITNIVFTILIVAAIICLVGFYLYDILIRKTPYEENLFRTVAIVFMLLGTLVRLCKTDGRKNLSIYEKAYANEMGFAFKNKPSQRKKLLCACRLYNESNYDKALKYLFQLLHECESERDSVPVLLFIALCYTDAGCTDDAIKSYYELLKIDSNNAQAHNNLGILLIANGDFETALQHYNKSIELKPDNYFAYVSRANYYFRIEKYSNAIADAKQALNIKNNGVEASSLLTIIYALQNDEENKKKYYHLSISSGKRPEDLNEAIQYFLNENNISEDIIQ